MLALPTVTGVNLVYGSAIAAMFAVPQMIVYTIMQRHISRTGGDYVWVSRSLGGFAGSTLTFMGITLETMPYLALIALSAVFAIGSVGVNLGYSSMVQLATSWSHSRLPVSHRFAHCSAVSLSQHFQTQLRFQNYFDILGYRNNFYRRIHCVATFRGERGSRKLCWLHLT